jgi:hypothetical protein
MIKRGDIKQHEYWKHGRKIIISTKAIERLSS